MSGDWFRNATWDDAIEREFERRLSRARRKEQYLRIQACTLAPSHPKVALGLLERYFQLPDNIDQAQAHVDRATALLALERVDEALAAYEAALAREAVFPGSLTQAYLELPYLVATRGMRSQYGRAMELLRLHESRLTFPVERFRWNAAQALIAAATGGSEAARKHAERALAAAGYESSGFRYHASVGLVTPRDDAVVERLEALLASRE